MDVETWLRSLGLGQYEQAFRDNDIDEAVLITLTAEDLQEIGVASLGHRKRLLMAIAALAGAHDAEGSPPLGASAQRPLAVAKEQAERRQLTVMFVDLVGSTALACRLDPEEMRELIRAYQDRVAGAVARFDGHLAKFMGDGVLAYFGWPRAYEDDAERAVRTGLCVTAAVAGLSTPSGETLAARVGLATGLVVVGDLIGCGEARERHVVGEAPNRAARLQAMAKPGSVVIDEPTRRLVNGLFEVEDLGPTRLKGVAEPVSAFTLLIEKVGMCRFDARSAIVRPLVGREIELGLLLQRWHQARAGAGQAILLIGEAGIGKSRMVRALMDAVHEDDHVCLRYQGSPLHTDQALWPVRQQLGFAAGLASDDDAQTRLTKLALLLRQAVEVDADTVALIATAAGMAEADPAWAAAAPRKRRERALDALLDQLLGWARQRPVLVIIEDAHWLDPTTLELFDQALDRTVKAPVFLLFTSRPDNLPSLSADPRVMPLPLSRLSRDAITRIAADAAGSTLPADVVEEGVTG
ncbi:AAA family ATPase [Azospirillum canadense]|uniref:AAA family ATPase n=1 Tax=Azospirillum canadense TaxID=403962 RepID=UPI0022277A07|nr:adenylate/guanylate cyclase domain-containing protein [Azospirillum canadense]MCW2239356.1 class 3 adenylate cyclase [Azospirillum canadense]